MIVDWIYNHPTWLWGTILVVGITALACFGLAIFHRMVRVDVRGAHNDLAGFTIAIISVVYAVLLAFIASGAEGLAPIIDAAPEPSSAQPVHASREIADLEEQAERLAADLAELKRAAGLAVDDEFPAAPQPFARPSPPPLGPSADWWAEHERAGLEWSPAVMRRGEEPDPKPAWPDYWPQRTAFEAESRNSN
jgi:hypothetical protein